MSEIYRDREEGARAKRAELLRRRRDELATMPHAVRRVVVARRARIAGAAATLAVGALFAIAGLVPSVQALVARALPGHIPAVLPTLVFGAWLAGVVVFFVARSSAEHRFAVAMSHHVLPGGDLDHDLQRLDHEKPDEVARASAHRLEVASAALPVAAAAYVVPATAWYAWHALVSRGWPRDDAFDDWLASHAVALASFGLLGLATAIVMTHRSARTPIAARVAAWSAIAGAGFIVFAWSVVGPVAIAATVALVGRRLRRERAQIRAEDPAAGSEIFTLRGVWRRTRAAASVTRAFARRHRRASIVVACSAAAVGMMMRPSKSPTVVTVAPTVAAAAAASPEPVVTPISTSRSISHVEPCANGQDCFAVRIEFLDPEAVQIPVFPGMTSIPAGWRAELRVGFANVDPTPRQIAIGFADHVGTLGDVDAHVWLATAACSTTPVSTTVRFVPPQEWTGVHVVDLIVWPRLVLNDCTPQDRAERVRPASYPLK